MFKKILLLGLACTTTAHLISSDTSSPTAHTFFKSSNAPLYLSQNSLPFNEATKKESSTFLRNAFTAEGFYYRSMDKKRLGNYLGFFDDASSAVYPFLRVSADPALTPTCLLPQDIVHDSANAAHALEKAYNPLSETLNFAPTIEQFGLTVTSSLQINNWITIHTIMPWMEARHYLGLTSSNVVKNTVENSIKSVSDFFAGNLSQKVGTSPNQQDALQFGKIVDRQSISGLADITLQCLLSPSLSSDIFVQCGLVATLPTTSRAIGKYLFEPLLGTGGHSLFGILGRAQGTLLTLPAFTVKIAAQGILKAGLSAQEVRSPSFFINYDAGVDAQFLRYGLGGKQNARRLFPLMNMLTQVVEVKPGKTVELSASLSGTFRRFTGIADYRFTHTGAETIAPLTDWPADVYALSQLSYAQASGSDSSPTYATFDVATDSALVSHAAITKQLINYQAAATPAQATHTFGFELHGAPVAQFPSTFIHIRGYYSFARALMFGVGGYGISCALSHTF